MLPIHPNSHRLLANALREGRRLEPAAAELGVGMGEALRSLAVLAAAAGIAQALAAQPAMNWTAETLDDYRLALIGAHCSRCGAARYAQVLLDEFRGWEPGQPAAAVFTGLDAQTARLIDGECCAEDL